MEIQFLTLDVFTRKRYHGNPLALIFIPGVAGLSQDQKQAIAREFNLSETVFLHLSENSLPSSDSVPEYVLDIFTVDMELPFAGHPTIGTAWYILNHPLISNIQRATIITKSGKISIKRGHDGKVHARIAHNLHIHQQGLRMLKNERKDFNHPDSTIAKAQQNAKLVSIVKGMTFLLIELTSLKDLAKLNPDGRSTHADIILDEGWNEGFVGKYYFVAGEKNEAGISEIRTRMLEGGIEDPATGSAASALAGWMVLSGKAGKPDIDGRYQFSVTQGVEMGRESVIGVVVYVDSNGEINSVELAGHAVQVMKGKLVV